MPEPQVQYAKTSDGVNIAFWTLGEGPPLIHMYLMFSHVQLEWEIPEFRTYYERLAAERMVVRFDTRGTGLSDREIDAAPLEAAVADLTGVADHLGLTRFALMAPLHSGPMAIRFAAENSDRVSDLILWCAYARGADYWDSPLVQGVLDLAGKDIGLYAETVAHQRFGWSEGEIAHGFAELARAAVTPEVLEIARRDLSQYDVTDLLSQVRARTLILHRRGFRELDSNAAQRMASSIPNARLVLLDGSSLAPFLGDAEPVFGAIEEFLGVSPGGVAEGAEAQPAGERGTAVILFTDIADSTALTTTLGDAVFRAKERLLDGSLRSAITDAGGTPVEGKVLGDGVMAVFSSASQAIECAIICRSLGDRADLPLHLGIHAGDVIREGNNVHGGAVQFAARVASASAAGEVLVSDTVRGLARTSAGVTFEDRGERELKGIEGPQRLYAVKDGD